MTLLPAHLRPIRKLVAAVAIVWAALIGYLLWAHGQLPEKVALHFNAEGKPNRWSSSSEMTLGMVLLATAEFVTFFAIAWILPRISYQLWNLPNKSYWLAPERAEQTTTGICRDLLIMGLATLLLLGVVQWDVVQANLVRAESNLVFTGWVVGSYLVLICGIIVAMIKRFNRVGD